jgi:hypothetical protein
MDWTSYAVTCVVKAVVNGEQLNFERAGYGLFGWLVTQ